MNDRQLEILKLYFSLLPDQLHGNFFGFDSTANVRNLGVIARLQQSLFDPAWAAQQSIISFE